MFQNVFKIYWLCNATLIDEVPMPGFIIVGLKVAYSHSEIFFAAHSVLPPETLYYYKFDKDKPNEKPTALIERKLKGFDETKYTLNYATYTVNDGTTLPISVIRKKNITGPRPCLINVYGM